MPESGWMKELNRNVIKWAEHYERSRCEFKPGNCSDCGTSQEGITIPTEHWILLTSGDPAGVLCASCMAHRASKIPGCIGIMGVLTFGKDYDDNGDGTLFERLTIMSTGKPAGEACADLMRLEDEVKIRHGKESEPTTEERNKIVERIAIDMLKQNSKHPLERIRSDRYISYIKQLCELALLIRYKKEVEADELRERMDKNWYKLSVEEMDMAGKFSASLDVNA